MTAVAPPPLHKRLQAAAAALSGRRTESLFDAEPHRTEQFQCRVDELVLDFAKHRLDDAARQTLLELANARGLLEAFSALINGETVTS